MREAVRNLDRLLHIQECMDNIQEFVGDKTFDEFVPNAETMTAIDDIKRGKVYHAKNTDDLFKQILG